MPAHHTHSLTRSSHGPAGAGGRRRVRWRLAALWLCLAGCAAEIDAPALEVASDVEVGVTQQAVVDGWVANGVNDFSGIVRLWATNTKFNEFRQFCSGVLLRNDVVLTAAHCLISTPDEVANGWPDTTNNVAFKIVVSSEGNAFAAWAIGVPAYAPDGRDLAALKIQTSLPVYTQGQVVTSGYFHAPGGTPSTGEPLFIVGFGATTSSPTTSTICKYVSQQSGQRLAGCLDHQLFLTAGLGGAFLNGSEVLTIGVRAASGDSGGPLYKLTGNLPFADLPLAGINSLAWRCVPLTSSNCGATAARVDDLGSWLAILQ